jgi:CheY-like chemotaxis protein
MFSLLVPRFEGALALEALGLMADPKSRSNPPKSRSVPPKDRPPQRMPRPVSSITGTPKGRLRKIDPSERARAPAPAPAKEAAKPPPLPPATPEKKRSVPPKARSVPPKARSTRPRAPSLPPTALILPKGPAALTMEAAPAPRSIVPTSTPDDVGSEAPAILVVDDDDAARRLIVRALRTLFTVYEARDGEEAVRVLERVPPIACVVTDIMMPRVDGVMLAKKMRADDRLKAVPIVFVTGRGAAASALDGLQVGARFTIQKPFKVKDLVEKVRTVVLTTAGSR